jgi:hypothetical protein
MLTRILAAGFSPGPHSRRFPPSSLFPHRAPARQRPARFVRHEQAGSSCRGGPTVTSAASKPMVSKDFAVVIVVSLALTISASSNLLNHNNRVAKNSTNQPSETSNEVRI